MKRLRLIRHAESAANAGLATTAPNSIPLTENGQLQARTLADSITSAPDLISPPPLIAPLQLHNQPQSASLTFHLKSGSSKNLRI